jgi:hypothetical protein
MPADPGRRSRRLRRLRVFIVHFRGGPPSGRRPACGDAAEADPGDVQAGARPHPPRELCRATWSGDVFVGITGAGRWVAPGEAISGLEDEYLLSGDRPKLIYVKAADEREPRLEVLLRRVQADDRAAFEGGLADPNLIWPGLRLRLPAAGAPGDAEDVETDVAPPGDLTVASAPPPGWSAGTPGAGHRPAGPTGVPGHGRRQAGSQTRLALEVATRQSAAGGYDGVVRRPGPVHRPGPGTGAIAAALGSGRRATGRCSICSSTGHGPASAGAGWLRAGAAGRGDVATLLTACPTARVLVTSRPRYGAGRARVAAARCRWARRWTCWSAPGVRPGWPRSGGPAPSGWPAGRRHPAGAGAGCRPAALLPPARCCAGSATGWTRRSTSPPGPSTCPTGSALRRPSRSYDLLSPSERGLLDRLSVFTGAFAGRGRGGGGGAGGDLLDPVLVGRAGMVEPAGRMRTASRGSACSAPSGRSPGAGGAPSARPRPNHHLAALVMRRPALLTGPDSRLWAAGGRRAGRPAVMMRGIRTDDAETVVRLAAPLFPYWWSRGLLAPMRGWPTGPRLPSAAPPDAAALMLELRDAADRGRRRGCGPAVPGPAAGRTGELGDRRWTHAWRPGLGKPRPPGAGRPGPAGRGGGDLSATGGWRSRCPPAASSRCSPATRRPRSGCTPSRWPRPTGSTPATCGRRCSTCSAPTPRSAGTWPGPGRGSPTRPGYTAS